jgi:hypothetical protein
LHPRGLDDLRVRGALREIVDVMKMDVMKMDVMKGDRYLVALVDRCCVDALPYTSPIFTS